MIIMPGSPHGTPGPARPALSSPLYLDGWKSLAGICHSYGCRLFVQIHPANAQAERDPALLLPDNMEKDYILKLTESYTRCALAAKEAGLPWRNIAGCKKNEISARPKTVDLLFSTGRLLINRRCIMLIAAIQKLRWDDEHPDQPEDKNIGNCNDWWDGFCYSWLDFVKYIDSDR